MMTAAQAYAYTKRFEDAYTAAMRPLCDELGAAQSAVDVLMFLANNPELNTAGDICKYRRLKPGIVSCRVDELVNDGLQNKLLHIPQEARTRLQETLERVINEGCTGLICILI